MVELTACQDQVPDECWRDHWPIASCRHPTHPELVGLWGVTIPQPGSREAEFSGRILYDGCHVTVSDTRELPMLERFQLEQGGWTVPHYRGARRTLARWEGDELVSISLLNLDTVARRSERQGVATLSLEGMGQRPRDRDAGITRMTRLDPRGCMDVASISLLCAREVVPHCQELTERYPDCVLSPPSRGHPARH